MIKAKIRPSLLLITLALIAGSRISADTLDHFVVSIWETDQGLPENSATSMVQDKDGFLWFGTFNGLVRFDGIGFKIFDRSNLPSLPSPAIVNLHYDQEDRLWVSTTAGLIIQDGDSWESLDKSKGWDGNYVRTFAESANHGTYLSTFDGKILRFDSGELRSLPPPPGEEEDGYFIHLDSEGLLWALDSEFIGSWDGEQWTRAEKASALLSHRKNYALAPARNGNHWILDALFLWQFNGDVPVSKTALPKDCTDTWSLFEDRAGKIWVASFTHGLFIFDSKTSEWTHLTSSDLLSHDSLRFVFQDQENHHWIGSSGGGLMQFQEPRFKSFGKQDKLQEPLIKSVSVGGDGSVYAATFGAGVSQLTSQGFEHLPTSNGKGVYAQSVLIGKQHKIWAGTSENGFYLADVGASLLKPDKSISLEDIRASYEDRSGQLWLGGRRGVFRRQGKQWTPFLLPEDITSSVTAIAQHPITNEIYVGTSTSGLYRTQGDRLVKATITRRFDDEGISSLLFLEEETLVIGTFDLGLLLFRKGTVVQLDAERGFPGSGISSTTLHEGHLWIGTNRGIVRLSLDHLRKMFSNSKTQFLGQVFTQSDGLSSIECPIGFQPTAAIDSDGQIWFASGKGLNVIAPRRLQINKVDLAIAFDGLSFTDSEGLTRRFEDVPEKTVFSIPPDHSNLTLQFTSPSFASPEKITFETTFKGPQQDITNLQSAREFQFHRLAPGDYELTVRARNGDGIWSKKTGVFNLSVAPFYWQTTPFKLSAGTSAIVITGTIGFWISRRKMKREMRFLESEHRLKNLLEQTQQSAEIGGWEYDTVTQRLYWTQEAYSIHHLAPDHPEITLEEFYQLYLPSDQSLLRHAIEQASRASKDFDLELRQKQDKTWLRVTGKVVDSPNRKIFGCVQNIQHQKDRDGQLRQSQKLEAIGTLAGGIAHDFNNILTGIRGYADLLNLDIRENDPAREHVKELQDAAGRATDLVKQILTYSRPSSENLKPLDPIEVSRHALKLIRASIPSSIAISSNLAADTPKILGSETQIHQLLLNLFTNAAQSIGELGSIRCTLSRLTVTESEAHPLGDLSPGEHAVFEVQDSGQGMDAEVLDRVFDPFFTTKSNASGTGLGLSVVLGIVKSHQGAIRVDTKLGEGTTFRVFFPSLKGKTSQSSATSNQIPAGQGQRIMVIDDDLDVIEVNTRMMKHLGYASDSYLSPTDAVAAFAKDSEAYDLVITDLTMPIMRGDIVIQRIRERNSKVPIILCSGNLDDQDPHKIDPAGRVLRLQKPYQYNELARAIASALALGESEASITEPQAPNASTEQHEVTPQH